MRLLNTRPREQGERLNEQIRSLGGIPISFPTLHIESTEWSCLAPPLDEASHAIFTSANAVTHFMKGLPKTALKAWPSHIQTTAIGLATAAAMAHHHLPVHHIPAVADSAHVLALDAFQTSHEQTILLIKGEGGLSLIQDGLTAKGATIMPLEVYRRKPVYYSPDAIRSLWQDTPIDIILFTSQEAMQQLACLLGDMGKIWLCNKPCLVISQRLANAAASLGISERLISPYNNLVDTLCALWRKTT